VAVIASIQRDSESIDLPAGSGGLQKITKDITITSVDLARSLLTFSYRMTKSYRSSIVPICVTAHLLNPTTIRFMVSIEEMYPRKNREITAEWQVTEYAV